jgi:ketosteroid isomerase-like protein
MNPKGLTALVLGGLLATAHAAHAADSSAKAVVKKRIEAVMRHDLDAIAALYAVDAIETSPGFCTPRIGVEGARRTYGELFQSYPTITDDMATYVVQGNEVAVQFVARVRKPDGSLLFEVPIANFLTVEHGRITRDVTYFDTKGRPCT